MKTNTRFTSLSQRLAFIAALFASKAGGMYAATKHDVRDEFARMQTTTTDSAHSPEVDEVDCSVSQVVENLFDREPVSPLDGILSKAERARVKRELRAYRLAQWANVSESSADYAVNA